MISTGCEGKKAVKSGPGKESVLTITSTKLVDISGWLTYKNEEFGFNFKYPSNWQPIIQNGGIYFYDKNKFKKLKSDLVEELSVKVYENYHDIDILVRNTFKVPAGQSILEFAKSGVSDFNNYSPVMMGDNQFIYLVSGAEIAFKSYLILSKTNNQIIWFSIPYYQNIDLISKVLLSVN